MRRHPGRRAVSRAGDPRDDQGRAAARRNGAGEELALSVQPVRRRSGGWSARWAATRADQGGRQRNRSTSRCSGLRGGRCVRGRGVRRGRRGRGFRRRGGGAQGHGVHEAGRVSGGKPRAPRRRRRHQRGRPNRRPPWRSRRARSRSGACRPDGRSDPHPHEVGADVGAERADAVVAGGAAAGLHPHLAGARSSSSWNTTASPGSSLKNASAARTDLPERFM